MRPGQNVDQPKVYRIQVQGTLDTKWSEWFNGMAITFEGASDEVPVTTLTGPVTDQAALRGILEKIWNLNLTLMSVNRVEANSA